MSLFSWWSNFFSTISKKISVFIFDTWSSLLAQMVKNLPAMKETLKFDPRVRTIPWRSEWQPMPVFLPGEFHGQRSLVGYSTWGHKDSDTTERSTLWVIFRYKITIRGLFFFFFWQIVMSHLITEYIYFRKWRAYFIVFLVHGVNTLLSALDNAFVGVSFEFKNIHTLQSSC